MEDDKSENQVLLTEGVVPNPVFRHVADGAPTQMGIDSATEGVTVQQQFGVIPPRAIPPPSPQSPQITDPRDITQFIPKD